MKNALLILSFLMLLKPLWPVMEYVMQYDYIVSTLCENKDNPEMECNGKCYLGKQLAKENGNQDKNPTQKTSHSEIAFNIIFEEVSSFSFQNFLEEIPENNFGFPLDFYRSINSNPLLQPPKHQLS